jgi:hypothetical protein
MDAPSSISSIPRRWRRWKWVLTVLAAVLLIAIVASGWVQFTPIVRSRTIGADEQFTAFGVSRGCAYYFRAIPLEGIRQRTPRLITWISPHVAEWDWLPKERGAGATNFYFATIPLWIPALPIGLLAGWGWRRDSIAQRPAKNRCLFCNYSRSGLTLDTLCPECGKPQA